jgi:GNAT superfamily N-acetyltransferase
MTTMETGTLQAVDKHKKPIIIDGSPITLEWYRTTDHATMVEIQKQALPVVAEAFADEERKFLLDDKFQIRKEYADLANQMSKDKPEEFATFIASARLGRERRVETSRNSWERWFKRTEQSMKDFSFTYFFVVAKNSKGNILGITAFYISPMLTQIFPWFDVYTQGDVLLEPIAIIPSAQGHGLARPLIFSILTLEPEIKRILLGTRIWITNAIAVYKKLGFTEYKREGISVKFVYEVKKGDL